MTRQEIVQTVLRKGNVIAIKGRDKEITVVYKDDGVFSTETLPKEDADIIRTYYSEHGEFDKMLALLTCISKKVGVVAKRDEQAWEEYKEFRGGQ